MNDLLIISYRTILGYIYLFILMRFMGKREIGQLNLFDLIILLSIADIMVFGIDEFNYSILYSFIPMLIVALIQKVIAVISLKSSRFRKLIDGNESIVIIKGKININEMKRVKYNMDDLYSQLREKNCKCIEQVEYAVLEANGKLSIFLNNESIDSSLPVIVSGKVNMPALRASGHNIRWLNNELSTNKLNIKDILGASIINGHIQVVKTIDNNI